MTVLANARIEVAEKAGSIDTVTLLICYVFLLMMIPSTLIVGSFGAAGAPAALFATVLLCCYLVARQNPVFQLDRGQQPVRMAASFFACSILATYVLANRTLLPVLQKNAADRGLVLMFGWIAVSLLAADGIGTVKRLRTLLRRITACATVLALVGVLEFITGLALIKYVSIPGLTVHTQFMDLMNRDGLVRVTATAAQPLEFSAVLAMSLPLALHHARIAPRAARLRRWLQVALITGAMTMTVSRSAMLELAVIAILLVPTWPKRDRRRACLVLLGLSALAWFLLPGMLREFGGLFGHLGSDSSATSRTGAYLAAVPFIAYHPLLGQGFQTFFPQIYFYVDNQYLMSLIETGVVGAVALLTLFVTGWFTARSARIAAVDCQTRDLAQCLAASVATAAVSFATFDGLSFSIATGLFFLLLGCVGAMWRLTGARRQSGV